MPSAAKTVDVQFLPPSRLRTHPKNMRRFYPEADVREMANSIKAKDGVLQAMLVVPGDENGTFYVVDGNMRLAGARLLGDECPPLKCEILSRTKAEQLLDMIVANQVRYNLRSDLPPAGYTIGFSGCVVKREAKAKRGRPRKLRRMS